MYFEIENTPEHIRKARKATVLKKDSPKEECPRLVLAPFSRPPQVVFDNVLVGTTCERYLEVINPSKQVQQITFGRELPIGLQIHLPGEWLVLEPETCYCLSMMWTPTQPTAVRETVRFTNENRGRYDIIVVLKAVVTIAKGKGQTKVNKISPGKIQKRTTKKYPINTYKKQCEVIYNTTEIKKTVNVMHSTIQHKVIKSSNKENAFPVNYMDYSGSRHNRCPFDSPNSIDFTFDTSEIFSNIRKTVDTKNQTYDKPQYNTQFEQNPNMHNILKPSNKQNINSSDTDIFENLTFTPLKIANKTDKLEKGPQIVLSMNSDSSFDDSLDLKMDNKENDTHSLICVTSTQPPNNWLSIKQNVLVENAQTFETPTIPSKKIPNTSSPKEFNSPNFTLNTELSRISDLSFLPQRFSTERKMVAKLNNDTHDIDDSVKLSSDTYTKDSPNTPMDYHPANVEIKHNYFNTKDSQSKMCRQSLFREYHYQQQKENYEKYLNVPHFEHPAWGNDLRSPPRSITPPLQSIPEESMQYADNQTIEKNASRMTNTFTVNRTFDKALESSSFSSNKPQTWSKKDLRAEPELWKIPTSQPKKSLKSQVNKKAQKVASNTKTVKISHTSNDLSKSVNLTTNLSFNQFGNVYSQSLTVDPFMSTTYFYDEEAVETFEKEFKKWLNCILTPPADLDSNTDQKFDLGKAWLDNKDKEVPAAPTIEQVCSAYHNSHRLQSLRRAARALIKSVEFVQVIQKLNVQIEKKLITIRNDRNLHLDIGLQKSVMEILLSYNPLWLRIGLEAIYGLVLPLKSNNDVEGMTTFIIQRMFRNPFLKNKHSKSSVPNMLLPAYMEAIKKFTLKKFFILIFFLDQAKQRKLISHDPCLFCRNAICKESREVIIRFTRDLIAGIGDITKHLRPLGYVVSHKQSFLDEYKYAVHNIAVDLRDGVRLTKVMEIILIKNNLLTQLRTPAISRLQKIHNVHVALNALKDANFVIHGDISPQDIADGHREKTLSLLWQLIHEFRAPLFEKAANVIQVWWKKKFEIIKEKRREQELLRLKINNAASVIQYWWRRIQYERLVELQMQQLTAASIVVQKYCRKWICRTRYCRFKRSVLKIEEWYRSIILMRNVKESYKHKVRAIIHIQRWWRKKSYEKKRKEELIRQKLNNAAVTIQNWWRKIQNERIAKECASIIIQKNYRMWTCQRKFCKLKKSVKKIEEWYRSILIMEKTRNEYKKIIRNCVVIQRWWRRQLAIILMKREAEEMLRRKRYGAAILIQYWWRKIQRERLIKFNNQQNASVVLQKYWRMWLCRTRFSKLKTCVLKIEQWYLSIIKMREAKNIYITKIKAINSIQIWWRKKMEEEKIKEELRIKQRNNAANTIQRWWHRIQYKRLVEFENRQKAAIVIQKYFRMWKCRKHLHKLKINVLKLEEWYRSILLMRESKQTYVNIIKSTRIIQIWWRKTLKDIRKRILEEELRRQALNNAANVIQIWWRRIQYERLVKYELMQTSATVVQKYFRMWYSRKLFYRKKTSVLKIEKWYTSIKIMRTEQQRFRSTVKAIVIIQRQWRITLSKIKAKKLKEELYRKKINKAASFIQCWWRQIQHERMVEYEMRQTASVVLQKYCRMWICRQRLHKLKVSVLKIETWYISITMMRKDKLNYSRQKEACKTIQSWWRIKLEIIKRKILREAMLRQKRIYAASLIQIWWQHIQSERLIKFQIQQRAAIKIQSYCRMWLSRSRFSKLKNSVLEIQKWYRSVVIMRIAKATLLQLKLQREQKRYCAAVVLQKHLKRWMCVKEYKYKITKIILIQTRIRGFIERKRYVNIKTSTVLIQRAWRGLLITRLVRCEFLQKRRIVTQLQAIIRGYIVRKHIEIKREFIQKVKAQQRQEWAASKIQALFRGHRARQQYASDIRIAELRSRWRAGALKSTQESMKERNEEAMDVLRNMSDIETVIRAFRSLELLTEVFPMMYDKIAASIIRRVYIYMHTVNRSISSIEMLKYAASVLVNLTRYRVTGPQIYSRERVMPTLKFMLRFSNSETELFCILASHLWLFAKYDEARQDLTECLHIPEYHKILITIKLNIERMKRMEKNSAVKKNKFTLPQNRNKTLNYSVCSSVLNSSFVLPALEPDYGITREDKPRYFEDAEQAIKCLLSTYRL